jgi:hypothetical protein
VTAPTPQIIVPGAGIHLIIGESMKPLTIQYSPNSSTAPTCSLVPPDGSISTMSCSCTTSGTCTFQIAGNATSGPYKVMEMKRMDIKLFINGAWITRKQDVFIYKKTLPSITKMYLASGTTVSDNPLLQNSNPTPVIYVENPIPNDPDGFEIKFYNGENCETLQESSYYWESGSFTDGYRTYGYEMILPSNNPAKRYPITAKYTDTAYDRGINDPVTVLPTLVKKESACSGSLAQINYDLNPVPPINISPPTGVEYVSATKTNGITTHLTLKVNGSLKKNDYINVYFTQVLYETEECGTYNSFLGRVQVPNDQTSINVTVPLDARIGGFATYYYTANIYRDLSDSICFDGGATYAR